LPVWVGRSELRLEKSILWLLHSFGSGTVHFSSNKFYKTVLYNRCSYRNGCSLTVATENAQEERRRSRFTSQHAGGVTDLVSSLTALYSTVYSSNVDSRVLKEAEQQQENVRLNGTLSNIAIQREQTLRLAAK